jgi:hypothetical protein
MLGGTSETAARALAEHESHLHAASTPAVRRPFLISRTRPTAASPPRSLPSRP